MLHPLPGLLALLAVQQPAAWRLVEEWRVGGEVNGPLSLGDVRGMGILPGGGIVVLDARDQQVHFFDSQGKPLQTVGRKGAGPGEFQRANGLAVGPGGEVIINDPGNNRLTRLSSSGALLKTYPIPNPWGYGYTWDAFYNGQGLLDEFVPIRKPDETTSVPARRVWSADFAKLDTILPRDCPNRPARNPADFVYSFRNERGGMTMGIPHVAPRLSAVRTREGSIWEGRHPEYLVLTRTPPDRCEPDLTIRLRGPRAGIPGPVRDSAVEQARANAARYGAPVPDLGKIPREYPGYDALFIDPAGQLWVERRGQSGRRRYEVWSPAGTQIAELVSPVVFQAYRPLLIGGDRVVGFVADEDEILYLASFRIVRSR